MSSVEKKTIVFQNKSKKYSTFALKSKVFLSYD